MNINADHMVLIEQRDWPVSNAHVTKYQYACNHALINPVVISTLGGEKNIKLRSMPSDSEKPR